MPKVTIERVWEMSDFTGALEPTADVEVTVQDLHSTGGAKVVNNPPKENSFKLFIQDGDTAVLYVTISDEHGTPFVTVEW